MSVEDACRLLLSATKLAKGGEIFVPKMYVVRIMDLAKAVIEELGGNNKDKIKVNVVGKLPGEKLFEELMTEDEALRSEETKDLFIIKPANL